MTQTPELSQVLDDLNNKNARYVRFELPDLHGTSRSKLVPLDKVESFARNGLNFYGGTLGLDTASMVVPGCGLHEEQNYADTHLIPDLNTLRPVPWKDGTYKLICDVNFLDGKPVEAAPRRLLARLLDVAADMGYEVMMGHEFEFYLLDGKTHEPLFEGLHIFNSMLNDYTDSIGDMLDYLCAMGIDIITHNCEYASSQFEINFGPGIGLEGADKAFTFKNAVKEIAHRQGLLATFMSKPWADRAGCGCHVHMCLLNKNDSSNAFLDNSDSDGLSAVSRSFVAGILAHTPALMALCDPTPNCYHRLAPHTFAPSNVSWGIEDRTALVRVKASKNENTHIEMRGASGISNPYLSASAVLAAGLLGIRDKLALAPEVAGPSEEDASLIKLPGSLEEALAGLADDQAMQEMLGADFVKLFTTVKQYELNRFRSHVTDWERNEYMMIY